MEARKAVGFLRRRSGKMVRNKSIVLKLSRFIKKSIYIARISTRHIIPNLKKFSRIQWRKPGSDHYNDLFLEEYQLSPPTTPLVRFKWKESGPMIFLCGCLGRMDKGEMGEEECVHFEDNDFAGTKNLLEPTFEDGDDSVDRRAEWFIAKFYQEMRMERQECVFV